MNINQILNEEKKLNDLFEKNSIEIIDGVIIKYME